MDAKVITALMVEAGRDPRVTKLRDDLDSLQKAVSIGADYQGLICKFCAKNTSANGRRGSGRRW